MLTSRGESYVLKRYKRVENSSFQYENAPDIEFKGRPANTVEKKNYRIMKGVHGNTDSVYVLCSNLPADIKPSDQIFFMGKMWLVESVGYYYDSSRVVNAGIMSDEYLMERSPKGITLQ